MAAVIERIDNLEQTVFRQECRRPVQTALQLTASRPKWSCTCGGVESEAGRAVGRVRGRVRQGWGRIRKLTIFKKSEPDMRVENKYPIPLRILISRSYSAYSRIKICLSIFSMNCCVETKEKSRILSTSHRNNSGESLVRGKPFSTFIVRMNGVKNSLSKCRKQNRIVSKTEVFIIRRFRFGVKPKGGVEF